MNRLHFKMIGVIRKRVRSIHCSWGGVAAMLKIDAASSFAHCNYIAQKEKVMMMMRDKLLQREVARTRAVEEILSSERTYINSLNVLYEVVLLFFSIKILKELF
jgi:hypothetical protein